MVQAVTLTLGEAAMVLDPPLSEQQLRAIIGALGWQPSGHRHTGRAGRPVAAYDATRILTLHSALVPFLDIPGVLSA